MLSDWCVCALYSVWFIYRGETVGYSPAGLAAAATSGLILLGLARSLLLGSLPDKGSVQ